MNTAPTIMDGKSQIDKLWRKYYCGKEIIPTD